MTGTLTLATRLAALPDEELTALLARRRLPRGRVDDFFDLAEALLEPGSLQAALAGLERPALSALAALTLHRPVAGEDAAERLAELESLALAEHDGNGFDTYDSVRERLGQWPDEELPSVLDLIAAQQPFTLTAIPDADPDSIDRYAAEHAFQTAGALAELLAELDREPARELQKGGLSLPDGRRLAAAMALDVSVVPETIWLAEIAGLIARDGALWLTTDAEEDWLSRSTAQRWSALAAAWLETLPDGIRTLLRQRAHARWGSALYEALEWLYPAAGDTLRGLTARFQATAELLGISAKDAPSRIGAALLESGAQAAAERLAVLLPQEVTQVYVQHDLSIVSPGPLAPSVDARLRRLAEVESRALASTYRVTAASLEKAIASGETAESLRGFLTEVSLTGIPQPLDYLIAESAKRYGLVRVRDNGPTAKVHTTVHSTDADIIGTIEVDQAFGPLAFVRDGERQLCSRFSRDVVYWALADAKYPVAAEDAQGRIVGVRKRHATVAPAAPTADRTVELVKRLRAATAAEAAQSPEAWLSRQLETAARSKTTLIVTVSLPDGREQEFLLEPTGVGGGRVRGRDRKADIERTLPLASIKAVRTP